MGDAELLLYSKALEDFTETSIRRVMERLSKSKREEYEAKIPELGELLTMVRMEMRKEHPWKPCGGCGKDGWVIRDLDGGSYAERCDCWKEWYANRPKKV